MTVKFIGAILVIISCGGFGFMIAATHRKEVRTLRTLIAALDFMDCELRYRMTPLPELCRVTASANHGIVKDIFLSLAMELDNQISPDVEKCMQAAIQKTKDTPMLTQKALRLLGASLGHFDLEGQLKGLDSVRNESRRILEGYTLNQEVRLRSYQTLGLCAGAALAILLI